MILRRWFQCRTNDFRRSRKTAAKYKFKEEEAIVSTAQFSEQKCDLRYRQMRSEGKQTGGKLLFLRGLKSSAGRTELMERSGISVVSYTLPQGKEATSSTREETN